eukprot:CAMPEP_0196140524 /NCGR_PEP_ID=MMETSP0910-20130528/7398_1 /TAXON_ID=49265 /ORGANISM="Thalassiosira rotula, Strain GSO102" /LENGTH=139 /DNA_ID=CAMNT_0041401397 /DNA_START=237 /DNA_END=655 /DNA_ORIENTATION=-
MARDSCNLKSSFKSVSSSSDESDTSDHSKRNGGLRRNVSFSSLEIRSYNITLGDAPTPNAISLDWEYDPSATEEHQVDHYEHHRNENAPPSEQAGDDHAPVTSSGPVDERRRILDEGYPEGDASGGPMCQAEGENSEER